MSNEILTKSDLIHKEKKLMKEIDRILEAIEGDCIPDNATFNKLSALEEELEEVRDLLYEQK